ncbi:MAG: SufD family Fe-S cluster assembly protein [Spirochaetia bacterium]|nr:SufD family Fe-S cluster assembly protein [Spirochaetia bacterium]
MAKISIQKKTSEDIFEELSRALNMADLKEKFPVRSMESWRRFDPLNLVSPMTDAVRNGTGFSRIKVDDKLNLIMHGAADWKKHDEIFLKKSLNQMELFKSTPETGFFEDFIKKSAGHENLQILRISKNVETLSAIEILPENATGLNLGIFYIYCEEGAKADLNIIKNPGQFDLSLIYIYQENNSSLKIKYLDENPGAASSGVGFIRSIQGNYSRLEAGIYNTSARQNKKLFIKNSLNEFAECKYNGFFAGALSHVDHDFYIEHLGSFSKSELLFKMGILDECYGIFWGDTKIIPNTRGCEGYQKNKNLILGKNARVDAIPRLRIQTEHVIASHGSATGEISDDEIFYLMSRGLSYEDARKLLLRAFFEDILRQSFGSDPDISNLFLMKIWNNLQNIIGMEITA